MAWQSYRGDSSLAYDTVVIASGESLSSVLETRGYVPVAIKMPADWTAADLTFQGCEASGGTYGNVYDDAGGEYTVPATDDDWIILNPAAFCSFPFLKIRSGTSGSAQNQAAARTLTVMLRQIDRRD